MLYLTPGVNGLDKDNCKTRRETFKVFGFGATYSRGLVVVINMSADDLTTQGASSIRSIWHFNENFTNNKTSDFCLCQLNIIHGVWFRLWLRIDNVPSHYRYQLRGTGVSHGIYTSCYCACYCCGYIVIFCCIQSNHFPMFFRVPLSEAMLTKS